MNKPRWQVLREWPPGFGGIERVAHELGNVWRTPIYSFDAQGDGQGSAAFPILDPLSVRYERQRLRCLHAGRLLIPLPGRSLWTLLLSSEPLHGHLPSPGVLMILMLARVVRPKRTVSAHWHAFLQSGSDFQGRMFGLYQRLALLALPWLSEVVTTSPVLVDELVRCGCSRSRVSLLSCCLDEALEQQALSLPLAEGKANEAMRVLFIGRLDSYKRLDWLLSALAQLSAPWHLDVVGDGPRRQMFEQQALGHPVYFHGRIDEASKLGCLARADVLVLPSDRSNEAFGIVQLEAMAAGRPALAFCCFRSGMGWVGALPALVWSQKPKDLAMVLQQLAVDRSLRQLLSVQARERYQALFSRTVWEQQLQGLR